MFIDLEPEAAPRVGFDGETEWWFFGTVADREEAPTWKAVLVYVGRDAHAFDGNRLRALDRDEYNEALAVAFEIDAQLVWGEDWATAIAEISGLNRRSTSRDRVRKNGLPPGVIANVIRLASRPDVRELAPVIRALARYHDVHKPTVEQREHGKPSLDLFSVAGVSVEILADFRGRERSGIIPTK